MPFTFDPTAAAKAARTSKQDELNALDKEINSLTGAIVARIQAAFDATQADNEAPVDVQIATGNKLRDTLKAMQASLAGAPSSGSQLSSDEQKLLELFRQGHLQFTQSEIDDPANPGQKIPLELVRDKRWRNPRSSKKDPAAPPASQPATPPAQPAPAPASPTTPAGGGRKVINWIKTH